MKPYPMVLGESATLDRVLSGESLARYGDGEFKICRHGRAKSQVESATLTERMVGILQNSGKCMVGIPNIWSDTPKADFWHKYERMAGLLADRPYVSSFVTRPDSAPWIDTPEYWAKVESLWKGRDVTLVRGSGKSLVAEDLVGAKRVTEILAPRQNAWIGGDEANPDPNAYKALLKRIGTPERVLICLGATATVMAVDLCAKGVHAVDCGHIGMFWRKHRKGEPMWVTEADKVSVVV